jgi:outer membrane protein assembly factor BamB
VFLPEMLLLATAFAADPPSEWSAFRGPNSSGVSSSVRALPADIGPDKDVIWKVAAPAGKSSPVLKKDRIFLTGHDGDKLLTVCFDQKTGAPLWKREILRSRTSHRNPLNDAAGPTPVTDDKAVYAFFADFGLVAYDLEGKEIWRAPLGPFENEHGMVASPAFADGRLIVLADLINGSHLAAYDAKTGKQVWKVVRRDTLGGYSTPAIYQPKKGPAQIVLSGPFELAGYSVNSGEKIWWVTGTAHQPKGVPVIDGDVAYINSFGLLGTYPDFEHALKQFDKDGNGTLSKEELKRWAWIHNNFEGFDLDRNGELNQAEWDGVMLAESALVAVRLDGRGDVTKTHVLWKQKKSLPNVPAPIVYQNTVYMVRDGGIFTSLDSKTGAVLKQGRLRGAMDTYYSSPVAGDGKIYVASQAGNLTVIQAGAQWEPIASAAFREEINATPALADGRIFLRTASSLYCFGQP